MLVGDISGNIDEGMKKITWHIYQELLKYNDVVVVKPLELIERKKEIKKVKPDIIHYVTGPSIYSFILLKYAKNYSDSPKTIISVTHPKNLLSKRLIKILKPDLLLVQAEDMKRFFESTGIQTLYFPNGVDVSKFRPVSEKEKLELREKYKIERDKFTVLHVGNLREGRNIDFFQKLVEDRDIQIVLVASTTIKKEKEVYNLIKSHPNITLIDYYVKNDITPLWVGENGSCSKVVEGTWKYFIKKYKESKNSSLSIHVIYPFSNMVASNLR